MSPITAMKRAIKSAKLLLLVVIFLILLCDSARNAVSAEKSPIVNPLHPDGQIGLLKPQEQKGSDLSHSDSPSSDATASKVESSAVNASKSDCKTEPCSPVSRSQDTLKVPASNASLHVLQQAEDIGHVDDPSIDMTKKLNPEALMRGFYVFAAISLIVMVYIAWKSFGKRPTQVHRYGVVASREDLEMAPLDSDEGEVDEDDTTHFDISKHRLK